MAPEVGLGQPYNLAADVYSWSMLMWFMLALEPPFGLVCILFYVVVVAALKCCVTTCSFNANQHLVPSLLYVQIVFQRNDLQPCHEERVTAGGV